MIRSAPLRYGASLVGITGALALAGCAGGTETDTSMTEGSGDTDAGSASGPYADGTYTADGSYTTPESVETIEVTIALEGDVITAVDVSGDPQTRESQEYQSRFIGGISDEVVGQSIDEISVSRVAGSSLTSGGFNEALEAIKDEATA